MANDRPTELVATVAMVLAGCAQPSPTVIANGQSNVNSIVATSNGMYWTDDGFGAPDRVMRAQSGAIDVIADDQICPMALATDQVSLFWLRCGAAVVSAPTTGGPTTLVLDSGTLANTYASFAVTSDTVYVTVAGPPGEIIAVPKQQGATATTVVSNLTAPGALAADDTNLYWIDSADAAVYQRARQADPATPPVRLATLTTDSSIMYWNGVIATDGVHLYWSDPLGNQAHAMRISDGTQSDLGTSGLAMAFALDASHVYWVSSAGQIERAPLTGGAAELVASLDATYYAASIAVTDDSVIYADNPEDCDPTIMDCYPTTIESVPK